MLLHISIRRDDLGEISDCVYPRDESRLQNTL